MDTLQQVMNKAYNVKLGVGALKTVTAAGAAEKLTEVTTLCNGVLLVPNVASSDDKVYAAEDSTLDSGADGGTNNAAPLPASGIVIPCRDASEMYIDSDTNGDGAYWQPLLER